ncbi:MAG TPA: hypothetical protein VIY55_14535 [Acetobacteraceae bacterium]|jgi:hypothetical protein
MVFRVPGSDAVAAGAQVGRLSADPAVLAAMRGTSAATGANFDMLLSYAAMESGINPAAHASTSSASGLYQFTEQTWLNAVREYGAAHGLGAEAALVTRQGGQLTVDDPAARQRILDLRNDPKVSTELATEHLRNLADILTPVLGRSPDPAETYLGHFLGAGGATQALQALQATPNRPAADLLPAAAAANRAMFYSPNGTPLTMSQFVQNIRDRVQRTYASLGAAMPASVVLSTTGSKADASEAGTTGWGSSSPSRSASMPQRMLLATLAEVFTRMDRPADRSRRQHGLPQAVVSALGSAAPS